MRKSLFLILLIQNTVFGQRYDGGIITTHYWHDYSIDLAFDSRFNPYTIKLNSTNVFEMTTTYEGEGNFSYDIDDYCSIVYGCDSINKQWTILNLNSNSLSNLQLTFDRNDFLYLTGNIKHSIITDSLEHFLAKYSKSAELIKFISLTDKPSSHYEIITDENNNIYIFNENNISQYSSDLELNWSAESVSPPGEYIDTFVYTINGLDTACLGNACHEVILNKYSKNGQKIWNKTIMKKGADENPVWNGQSHVNVNLYVGPTYIYLWGFFWGYWDLDPEGNSFWIQNKDVYLTPTHREIPDPRLFVAKYNKSGNFLWAKDFEYYYPSTYLFTGDSEGNIVMISRCKKDRTKINPNDYHVVSGTYSDTYMTMLNHDGSTRWFHRLFNNDKISTVSNMDIVNDTLLYLSGHYWGSSITFYLGNEPDYTDGRLTDGVDIFSANYNLNVSVPQVINHIFTDNSTNKHKIGIYPNPVSKTLYLDFTKGIIKEAFIAIYNTNGQRVVSMSKVNISGEISLNIGELPSGIYLIEIQNEDGHYTQKFIKD